MSRPYLPKADSRLPDNYQVKFHRHDGKTDVFTVSSHKLVDKILVIDQQGRRVMDGNGVPLWHPAPVPYFELEVFVEDGHHIYKFYPLSSVVSWEFDKNWTKIIEIHRELEEKKNKENKEVS